MQMSGLMENTLETTLMGIPASGLILRITKSGEKNVLAVEVKNEGQNSRWYSGSGIYRHVWLKVMDPVHVAQWGIAIKTPLVTTSSAEINIKTSVLNESSENKNRKTRHPDHEYRGVRISQN